MAIGAHFNTNTITSNCIDDVSLFNDADKEKSLESKKRKINEMGQYSKRKKGKNISNRPIELDEKKKGLEQANRVVQILKSSAYDIEKSIERFKSLFHRKKHELLYLSNLVHKKIGIEIMRSEISNETFKVITKDLKTVFNIINQMESIIVSPLNNTNYNAQANISIEITSLLSRVVANNITSSECRGSSVSFSIIVLTVLKNNGR